MTPIIRFSGRFHFQMPEYNNAPRGAEIPFNPTQPAIEVMAVTGCDPADYFRFRFRDCRVTGVIAPNGATIDDPAQDALIGEAVDLSGFLVDVSPSAICAVLHAGRMSVGTALAGRVAPAFQSDLRLNVRPTGFGDETAAAHFTTRVALTSPAGGVASPAAQALAAAKEVELHFHMNRYIRLFDAETGEHRPNGLVGDVFGYLRPAPAGSAADGLRLANRRLVAHPRLSGNPDVERAFLTDTGGMGIVRISDIDGFYDLDLDKRTVVLRPLHFLPYLDMAYATPTSRGIVKELVAYSTGPGGEVELGRFSGDHDEMVRTGGVLGFTVPQGTSLADLKLAIDAVTPDGNRHPLMIETDWDIALSTERGFTLGSREAAETGATVYFHNRPAPGEKVKFRSDTDGRSPIVAEIAPIGSDTTDANGQVRAIIQAKDLTALGNIPDPVTESTIDAAPFDRNYGNRVYMSIPNPLRRTRNKVEEIQMCVRVLHKVDAAAIPSPVSFSRHVKPLFSYHMRFFPWLHTRRSGSGFARFLDLSSYDSIADDIDEIIDRLDRADDDERKMPRSRDIPVGTIEVLRKWQSDGLPDDTV